MSTQDPMFQRNLTGPTIQKARVLDVDMRFYTLTVGTEFTKKPLTWVPFASPYQHFDNGEGIYFMPEVGSICWLCEPSDGSMPFVLAWASAADEGDFRAKKRDLNPGDIYLGTRDENSIILRRGGVVQIGATPLAQRIYLPVDNIIRDFCQNFELHTFGGDLTWTVDIPESQTDGARPTTLKLSAREFANTPGPIASLEIGSHTGDKNTILSLVLRGSGAKGAPPKITLKMEKTGKISWVVEGAVTWTFRNTFTMTVTREATIRSLTKATFAGAVSADVMGGVVGITASAGSVAIQAAGGTLIQTGGSGPALVVGKGAQGVLLETLLAWLVSHTHPVIGPDTGKPTEPIVSSTVVAMDLKTS